MKRIRRAMPQPAIVNAVVSADPPGLATKAKPKVRPELRGGPPESTTILISPFNTCCKVGAERTR